MKRVKGWDVFVAACGLTALVLATTAVIAFAHGELESGFDTLVGSLAVAGIGALLVKMRAAPTVGMVVDDEKLTVQFNGWDRLWALRRSAVVPVAAVRSVTISPINSLQSGAAPSRWHRGTTLRGLIRAGSGHTAGVAELWDIRADGGDLLCIDLDDTAPYRRIVLQVPDPEAIRHALSRAR